MQLPRFPFMVETPRYPGPQNEQQAEHIRQENEAEADALEKKPKDMLIKSADFPISYMLVYRMILENMCSHRPEAK